MSGLPEILRTAPLSRAMNMNIETELLFPVINSQRNVRFVFDKKGILDANSRLQLQITTDTKQTFNTSLDGASEEQGLERVIEYTNDGVALATTSIIPVAAEPSDVDDFYNGYLLRITAGTNAGETKAITGYVQATRTLTTAAFTAPVDATSVCKILDPKSLIIAQMDIEDDYVESIIGYELTNKQGGDEAKEVIEYLPVGVFGIDRHVAYVETDWTRASTTVGASTYELTHEAVEPECFLPISTGASCLIERCWLEIGGKRVSTLNNVGQWNTIKNLSLTNEYRKQVLQYQEGCNDAVKPMTQEYTDNSDIFNKLIPPKVELHNKINLTAKTSPTFSISLGDLIPMLRGFQIPLFLIKDEVSLNFELTRDRIGERYCMPHRPAGNDIETSFNLEKTLLMCDYNFFPSQMSSVSSQVNSGTGLILPYDEVFGVEHQELKVADPGGGDDNFTRVSYSKQLAVGGKLVKSIIVQRENPTQSKLLGVYNSVDLQRPSSINFQIDSKMYYTNDIVNSSQKYDEVGKIWGVPLQIPAGRYTWQGQTTGSVKGTAPTYTTGNQALTNFRIENWAVDDNMTAKSHYMGVDFTLSEGSAYVNGLRIGNHPIIFRDVQERIKDNEEFDNTYKLRFFITQQNMLALKNGFVEVIE